MVQNYVYVQGHVHLEELIYSFEAFSTLVFTLCLFVWLSSWPRPMTSSSQTINLKILESYCKVVA